MKQRPHLTDETITSDSATSSDDTLPQSEEDQLKTAQLSRVHNQPPGTAVGFDLIRSLGTGAYGSVWLAKERKTGRFVAVKFFSRRGQGWALLGREVEKLAALDSSHHIVGLIDVGWDADPPYYAMEYLPNGSLATYLDTGPLAPAEAVEIAKDVLKGLVHAHGSGILHCDLKPANVLLDQDFHPRLCDFGQARLSEEQRPALGTLFYMAPEQADLKALPDARWDVYALGALLFQMLTGHLPHRNPATEERLARCNSLAERLTTYREIIHNSGQPVGLADIRGVDRSLVEIIETCLAPQPEARYRNAQATLDAFNARDRRRGRRPLVVLGLVGPILLLGAMFPFFLTTMRNAEVTAKATLIERALESDALAAKLLARSLTQELQDRTVELEQVASSSTLVAAVEQAQDSGWADRTAIENYITRRKSYADERRSRLNLTRDTSWFLTDNQGLQRWREPYKSSTHDYDFSWKDYFHGQGTEYDQTTGGSNPPPKDLKPINTSHVSTVFRSDATGFYMVAITTPIKNEKGEVIGVLGRTQHLWELLDDYKQGGTQQSVANSDVLESDRDPDDEKQQLVLIDSRNWQLVDHPWLSEENVKNLDEVSLTGLQLTEGTANLLDRRLKLIKSGEKETAIQLDHYQDPVGQKQYAPDLYGDTWLAATYPVSGPDWIALVQERRQTAVASAERMRSHLFIYAGLSMAVGGVLIVTFWYFVTQALAERTRQNRTRTTNGDTSDESASIA